MILFGNYIFQLGIEHNWQLLYKRMCQICADSGNCPANFHFQSKCQSFKILNILLCRWLQGNACSHALSGQEEEKRCSNSMLGHSTISCRAGWMKSSAQKVRGRCGSLVVMQPLLLAWRENKLLWQKPGGRHNKRCRIKGIITSNSLTVHRTELSETWTKEKQFTSKRSSSHL